MKAKLKTKQSKFVNVTIQVERTIEFERVVRMPRDKYEKLSKTAYHSASFKKMKEAKESFIDLVPIKEEYYIDEPEQAILLDVEIEEVRPRIYTKKL